MNPHRRTFVNHRFVLGRLRARSKSHTTLNMECVTILYKCQFQCVKCLTDALLSTTELFVVVTRARSKSHTTSNTECVMILYTCRFSESNPHRHTFEQHRVVLGSDSCRRSYLIFHLDSNKQHFFSCT